jgi:large subunit ribosomal protein L29
MNADKIRNLTEEELAHQERDLADQLFKLKFQLNMGQTESLKKIRGLRKDIARVKTILGERERTTASVTTASATKPSATKASATKASATEKR